MGFPRQEYWSTIPFSRESSQPGIEPRSPTLQADSLPSEPPGKPLFSIKVKKKKKLYWMITINDYICAKSVAEFWTDRNSSVTYFNDFLNASHMSPVNPSPKLWETHITPTLQMCFYPAVWQREGIWTQNMVMVQRETLTSCWGIRRQQHLQNFSITRLKFRHDVSLADWQLSRIEGSQLRWATLLRNQ